MRLNRTAQFGLIVIVFAMGLLVFYALRRSPEPPQQANNANGNMVMVSANPGQAPQPAPSGLAFKARYDIPQRSIVTPSMFEMTQLGEGSEEIYVTNLRKQGVGFVTAKPILKGRKLRQDDLLGHLSELGVSAAVQDGYRAVAVAIPNKSTLHDIVSIGDYVDVVATFEQVETRVLADGVRVLAVDVYGGNYKTVSIGKRGDYPGDDRPGGPPPPPDPQGNPVTPSPDGQPSPTQPPAAGTPPPVKPEASITLEVRPEQAAAIVMAQAANAPLDFLIQPRPTTLSLPSLTEVRLTKPQVAPYAVASKRGGAAPVNKAAEGAFKEARNTFTKIGNAVDRVPVFPNMGSSGSLEPAKVAPLKRTYEITIYPDGQPARTNTVPLPQ